MWQWPICWLMSPWLRNISSTSAGRKNSARHCSIYWHRRSDASEIAAAYLKIHQALRCNAAERAADAVLEVIDQQSIN